MFMYKNKILSGMAVLACAVVTSGGAYAATDNSVIFADSFDRAKSNIVRNGWSELERRNKSVSITRKGKLSLKGNKKRSKADAAVLSSVMDASKFKSMTVSFDWKARKKNEANDKLFVYATTDKHADMTDMSAWTKVFKGSANGKKSKKTTESISLELGGDLSNLRLMVVSNVSKKKAGRAEGFSVGKIKVEGQKIAPLFPKEGEPVKKEPALPKFDDLDQSEVSAVPVPASLPLLIAGLGGLGYAARRKRKSA